SPDRRPPFARLAKPRNPERAIYLLPRGVIAREMCMPSVGLRVLTMALMFAAMAPDARAQTGRVGGGAFVAPAPAGAPPPAPAPRAGARAPVAAAAAAPRAPFGRAAGCRPPFPAPRRCTSSGACSERNATASAARHRAPRHHSHWLGPCRSYIAGAAHAFRRG